MDKWVYRFYHKIVCISEEVRQVLKSHTGFGEDRLIVIKNGVDLSIIKESLPIQKEQIHKNLWSTDKIVIQVSGFREQKDQKTVIKSLLHLPENVKLLLVGDGILKGQNESLATQLGLENRVIFLGQRLDIPQLLKSSDVVVLSSHYEGLSLSSIEGMASGKPFIASDVPGLRDIVSGAGLLFPKEDDTALAKNIQRLLNDTEFYQTTVQNCQHRASNYSIDRLIDKHLFLYKHILKSQ